MPTRTLVLVLLGVAALVVAPLGQGNYIIYVLCSWLIMSMQSTGQGSTHRSQPVHKLLITVCICLAAPRMASTGQACMHLVQPMHSGSRMKTTLSVLCSPCRPFSGFGFLPNNVAKARMPASPPGGHWLMSAKPDAIASA